VRFSLGRELTTMEEIDFVCNVLPEIVKRVQTKNFSHK